MGGTENGLYALKKVLVQTEEQLELVKHEIHVLTLFNHPNLIPLLDYSIISVKVRILFSLLATLSLVAPGESRLMFKGDGS
jgi:serine/threonine protein kinase